MQSVPLAAKQVIFQGTGRTLRITRTEGFKYVAIENDAASAGVVTITGSTQNIGGVASTTMTVAAGINFTFGDGEHDIFELTIAIPAGTTARVVGTYLSPI